MPSNKKSVSLMLSYVILIAIAISMWGMVYVWMKYSANISPPVDCKEGTSALVIGNECGDEETLILDIKNNGRFNISGVIVSVGINAKETPTTYLIPYAITGEKKPKNEGYYIFEKPLKPSETQKIFFSNSYKSGDSQETIDLSEIKIVQIQPFIYIKKDKILCQNAIIKQEITPCII